MSSKTNSVSSDKESFKQTEGKQQNGDISGIGLRDRSSTWSNSNKPRLDNNQGTLIRERVNSYCGKRDCTQN